MNHTPATRQKISQTLKSKGCKPPWQLSPFTQKGYKRAEVAGEDAEQRRLVVLLDYNRTKIVSEETRLKMSEAKRGKKNVGWRGGATSKRQKLYNTLETKEWRRQVYKRDGYTCQKCGARQNLNAHHIQDVSRYPELCFDVSNGETLCLSCHKETDNY